MTMLTRKPQVSDRLAAAGIVILYAIFTVPWIVVSRHLLTNAVDPLLMLRIELTKGVAFAAVTSVLFYLHVLFFSKPVPGVIFEATYLPRPSIG